jgi:uncharacterized protein (TIGR00661 family)
MRILYGVVGEGMGHATRSRVLLEELTKEHEVHIVVSGRARDYLSKRFENVHGIWGYTLAYEGNSVSKWQTLLQNLQGAVTGWPRNIRQYFELVEKFQPDVVVSDFESFSYMFGKVHRLPVISVDNMQIINRCKHEPELLSGFEDAFEGTRAIVKAKLPGAFHYLITTFFYPPALKERTDASQLSDGARNGRDEVLDIELNDLFAVVISGVGHRDGCMNRLAVRDLVAVELDVRVFECRVTQPIAKWIQRTVRCVEIT